MTFPIRTLSSEKSHQIQVYGPKNSIDSPLQCFALSLRTSVFLVGSSSFADRKEFLV